MTRRRRKLFVRLTALMLGLLLVGTGVLPASAAQYFTISGSGSSWAGNALAQWVADVKTQGVTVNYNPAGSSTGRKEFARGITEFGVSEIPYTGDTADPQDQIYPPFSYGMLPAVAGGTSFMYHLPVGGQRFTNLKLSQAAIAGIFSGQITQWNDAAIAADNPGVNLPAQRITVVVRSDGSGATAQFTLWMLRQFPASYAFLCSKTGCNPNNATSYFPTNSATLPNFVAQNQSSGVTTYTQNTPYTINYDEYSYALQVGFPVAQVRNAAGFYTVPTDSAVAVALTQASINTDQNSQNYLSQDLSAVYPYGDPRSYPLSAYSYFVVPTQTTSDFQAQEGATLAYFLKYSLCEGQRTMGALGYSPLPMNLVLAALDQVERVPGIDASVSSEITAIRAGTLGSGGGNPCSNPTFQPGDSPSHNLLVDQAPFPAGCDAACHAPWKLPSSGDNNGPSYGGGGTANPGTGTGQGGANTGGNTANSGAQGGTAQQVCDADTGICSDVDALNASNTGRAVAVPAVIAGQQGWTGSQTLMVIAGLLIGTLILVPPIVSRTAGGLRARR